jgi:hypothetical protein
MSIGATAGAAIGMKMCGPPCAAIGSKMGVYLADKGSKYGKKLSKKLRSRVKQRLGISHMKTKKRRASTKSKKGKKKRKRTS